MEKMAGKEVYATLEMEVITFDGEDVITTSGGIDGAEAELLL